MAKNIDKLVDAFREFLEGVEGASEVEESAPRARKTAAKSAAPAKRTAAKKTAPARKTSSTKVEKGSLDRDEVERMSIKELRELAVEAGLREQKLKSKILEELDKKNFFADEEDEDEEVEEDDEEEEEEEEEGEYSRDELSEMSLPALKKIAKEEGHSAADYRGMDQDALIDLILGEEVEEDDEEEEEEEEAEDGEIVVDPDELGSMGLAELKEFAKTVGVKVPTSKAKNKKAIIDLIMAAAEEEE